jgi:disulfide bond formation protein DsbB
MQARFLVVLSLLFALLFVLSACGGAASTPSLPPATARPAGPVGDATKGAEAFAGTCAGCHGVDAKGLPGLGKDMTISEFIKGQSDAELLAFIKTGRSTSDPANTTGVDMPPRGGNPVLTDQDLADVIAYIRTLVK